MKTSSISTVIITISTPIITNNIIISRTLTEQRPGFLSFSKHKAHAVHCEQHFFFVEKTVLTTGELEKKPYHLLFKASALEMNAVGEISNQRENDCNKLLLTMHTGTK